MIRFCFLMGLSYFFSIGIYASPKLRSERVRVVVDKVVVHGRIVHVDGWGAVPANPEVAKEFDKLKDRTSYDCEVVFYEGMTGWGSGIEGQVSPVQMVFDISDCSEVSE